MDGNWGCFGGHRSYRLLEFECRHEHERVERVECLQRIERLQRIEHLQRIERVEREPLERIGSVKRLGGCIRKRDVGQQRWALVGFQLWRFELGFGVRFFRRIQRRDDRRRPVDG